MEQLVEWELAGETEVLGENVLQCLFVYHISRITWPGVERGSPRWEDGPPMKDFEIHQIDVECEDATHIKSRFRLGLLCLELYVVIPGIGQLKMRVGVRIPGLKRSYARYANADW
jgi:hypothetical protein